jgi:predicted CopG family antitoxin
MGHKTLTISEEAYGALAGMKKERESFTEAILRFTSKVERGTLLDYVRTLEPDDEFAETLEGVVGERGKIVLKSPEL